MDNKYKYSYEDNHTYCYKGTSVLINLLGITNDEDLYNAERELVSLRTLELIENPIKGEFDFNYLKSIHKYLFQDIYKWAGNIRTCNIAKKDLFCLAMYIEPAAKDIFQNLKKEKYFIDYEYEEKLNKLVDLFADINALHPFREGNGRSQRFFIEALAKINGIYLDLTGVNKMDMIIASHESVNGNVRKLKIMFENNSKSISKEEQLEYINLYCSEKIKKLLKQKVIN